MGLLLETQRLMLRLWTAEDIALLAAIDADPRVCAYYPNPFTARQSAAAVQRYRASYDRDGFCMMAAVRKQDKRLIGILGMQVLPFPVAGLPRQSVELGWRLAYDVWGQGLATEGASAVIRYAFDKLGLTQLVAITAIVNAPSRRVMEKLGMRHDPSLDFPHPDVPKGHVLNPHVVYRMRKNK